MKNKALYIKHRSNFWNKLFDNVNFHLLLEKHLCHLSTYFSILWYQIAKGGRFVSKVKWHKFIFRSLNVLRSSLSDVSTNKNDNNFQIIDIYVFICIFTSHYLRMLPTIWYMASIVRVNICMINKSIYFS